MTTVVDLDYDTNPSELYLLLQKKDWSAALQRISSHPHEVSAWVSRTDKQTEKLRWRLLPLHGAVIFQAPDTVIEELLNVFPAGAKSADDQGMIPLHLCFRVSSPESVVKLLLTSFPQSVDATDLKGRTPRDFASDDAHLKILNKFTAAASVAAVRSTLVHAAKQKSSMVTLSPHQQTLLDEKLAQMKTKHIEDMEKVEQSTAAKEFELQQTITALQAEMNKNRETRQVLAKHIVSLEAQLNNRTDTGEFLASKISSLEVSLEETTVIMKEKEASLKTALDKITEEKDQAEQVCQTLRQEREEILEKRSQHMRNLNKEKETLEAHVSKHDERVMMLNTEYVNARSEAALLEDELKKRIEHESMLTSQVHSLASELSNMARDGGKSNDTTYSERIAALEDERSELRKVVASLSKKIYMVSEFLESMQSEQAEIIKQAADQELEMNKTVKDHADIISYAKRQGEMFDQAREEQEAVAAILSRREQSL